MSIDANSLINFAKTTLGIPYSWGGGGVSGTSYGVDQGASTNGFDCSSLMQYIFKQYGVDLPRTTYEQVNVGAQVDYSNLRAGDMVFFDQTSQGPGHVGMYLGNDKFIEAPHTGANVRISNLSDYRDVFVGGRRVADIAGGGQYDPSMNSTGTAPALPSAAAATANSASILSPTDLAQRYGWAYSFLKSSPDVKDVFAQAVKGSWTAGKFQAEIQKTGWWRTTSESARQTQVTKSTDPATYQAQLNSAVADIQTKAHQMGAYPSDAVIQKMAKDGLDFGYNDSQLTQILAGYIKFSNDHLGGQAGQVEDRAREVAYKNGVPLTDQTIKNNAIAILKGQKSMEQFTNDLKTQAISMFPAYKDQLKAGENMSDIAQPYVDMMSQVLERDPSNITLSDPMIKKALNGLSADGQPIGMSLNDFEAMLKSQPGWQQTSNAQQAVMSAGNSVLKSLGLVS